MEVVDVPSALQDKLGPEATAGLLDVLHAARQEWTAEVTTAAVERFERRLTEETGALRLAFSQGDAALRQEVFALRLEISGLRSEMREGDANLRLEIRELGLTLRNDMNELRFDLLKWSFAFWIGQVIAIAGIVSLMVRFAQT